MSLNNSSAIIAALSIVSCLVAYVSKGTIPDSLTLLATTTVGGYLGVTVPTHKQTTN
jgi:hypothetical protein